MVIHCAYINYNDRVFFITHQQALDFLKIFTHILFVLVYGDNKTLFLGVNTLESMPSIYLCTHALKY